ncbi:hypothetical protein AB0J83_42070 [Actinoplanes sp. NPDC049596]|uniref:serine/threonine protein kinase n=1 Tax=unclassified Actinoplanes TaxID=2626549 RepID=UPI00343AF1F0
MSSKVNLLCGERPNDPATLYRLDLAFDGSGQAYVYRGIEPGASGRRVTVRVWRPNRSRPFDEQKQSWKRGAALLRRLKGVPGICLPVADFDGFAPWSPGTRPSGNKVPIQVLEWVEGENLKDRLEPGSHLAAEQGELDAPRVLHELARILGELHRRGPIVHQDVSLSNVIITPAGDPVLIDFTSARDDGDLTHYAGTFGGSAPELFERINGGDPASWQHPEPSTAADIFGFGAIAYYLLTGVTWRTGVVESLPTSGLPDALRDHLMLVLAGDASRRAPVDGLDEWIDRLADLVVTTGHRTPRVRWTPPVIPGPRAAADNTEAVREYDTPKDPWAAAAPYTDPLSTLPPEFFQDGHAPVVALPEVGAAAEFVAVADLLSAPAVVSAGVGVRIAPPGTGPVVLVPGFVPGLEERTDRWVNNEGRAPVVTPPLDPTRQMPRPPTPDTTDDALSGPADDDPGPELPPTVVRPAVRHRLTLWQRVRIGGDYIIVLAVAAVGAWLIWLIGSGNLTNVNAAGSILFFAIGAAVADLLGQAVGAVGFSAATRSDRRMLFWRALHAPAAAVLVGAVFTYTWLLATGA